MVRVPAGVRVSRKRVRAPHRVPVAHFGSFPQRGSDEDALAAHDRREGVAQAMCVTLQRFFGRLL